MPAAGDRLPASQADPGADTLEADHVITICGGQAPGREPAGRGPGGVDRGAAGSPDRAQGTQRAAMVPT